MEFSANLGFLYTDRPLPEAMQAAARDGFSAVEMHWPYAIPAAELRRIAESEGLSVLSINTPTGDRPGDFGLAAVAGREGEFEAGLSLAVDYARELGAAAVHVMAGVNGDGNSFSRNLSRAARLAPDLTLLIEPINQRDRPGYFLRNTAQALEVIGEVGASNLRLLFDCYHVHATEADVAERLAAVFEHVGHVQIAGCPDRHEPNEGVLAYPPLLRQLLALGYTKPIGAEYRPRGRTEAGLGWLNRWRGI